MRLLHIYALTLFSFATCNSDTQWKNVKEVLGHIPYLHQEALPVFKTDESTTPIETAVFNAIGAARGSNTIDDLVSVVLWQPHMPGTSALQTYDNPRLLHIGTMLERLIPNERGVVLLLRVTNEDAFKCSKGIFLLYRKLGRNAKNRREFDWSIGIISAFETVPNSIYEIAKGLLLAGMGTNIEITQENLPYDPLSGASQDIVIRHSHIVYTAWLTHILLRVPRASVQDVYQAVQRFRNNYGRKADQALKRHIEELANRWRSETIRAPDTADFCMVLNDHEF